MADVVIPPAGWVANRRVHQLLLHVVEGRTDAATQLLAVVPDVPDLEHVEHLLQVIAPDSPRSDLVDARARIYILAGHVVNAARAKRIPDHALAFTYRATAARSYAASEEGPQP